MLQTITRKGLEKHLDEIVITETAKGKLINEEFSGKGYLRGSFIKNASSSKQKPTDFYFEFNKTIKTKNWQNYNLQNGDIITITFVSEFF